MMDAVWQRGRRAALGMLGAGVVALVAACSTGSGLGGPAATATPGTGSTVPLARAPEPVPDRGPVPVALLVPIGSDSTRVATDARAIVQAAELALEEDGRGQVRLVVLDTQGTPIGAEAAARAALTSGARLVLGPLFGANTPTVGRIAAGGGVRTISFSTDTSVAGEPVYVSGFTPEGEVARILDFAGRNGLRQLGIYAPDVPTGTAALRGIEASAAAAGMTVGARTIYPRSFQDIEATAPNFALEASAAGVDALLLPDFGEGLAIAGSFMDFHRISQPEVRYLGIGGWESRTTLREDSLRGGWFAGADPEAKRAFYTRYSERYGSVPPFVAVLGYDAASMAAELVATARATRAPEPFSAAAITRPEGFRGAVGAFRFRPDGRAERGLAILQVADGRFAVLEPAQQRFGAGF